MKWNDKGFFSITNMAITVLLGVSSLCVYYLWTRDTAMVTKYSIYLVVIFTILYFLDIYLIIKRTKYVSELKENAWYAIHAHNDVLSLIALRLVSDDQGRLDPQSVKSEIIWYKYLGAFVEGEFKVNGLVRKGLIGERVHLSAMPFPTDNVGGTLLVW
jgi:hypothetical protein